MGKRNQEHHEDLRDGCEKVAGDYVAAAAKAAGELYCYGHSNVPFKPTKAKDVQFRPNANQAMSYFVGAKAVSDGIPEDGGFAINGGKGWSEVVFDNRQIDCHGSVAIAMGNYYFTNATDQSKTSRTDTGYGKILVEPRMAMQARLRQPNFICRNLCGAARE